MTGLQFVAEPALAPHFAAALDHHFRRCREQAIPVPRELIAFRDWAVVVRDGLSSPPLAPVPDPEPVDAVLLLDLPTVGQRLSCSLTKVKGLVRAGELPVVLLGGVQRVRAADLDEYVAGLSGSFRDRLDEKDAG